MLTTPEDLDAEAPQVNPMPRLKRVADVADGDYYPTAPYLTLALLAVEKFEGEIGEFACGQGHIAETLRRTIPNPVLASDKFYRGYGHGGIALEKILQAKGEGAVANTITNPPYAKGVIENFIETCVRLSRHKCALLMRLGALEGAKRHRLYQRHPFARVHVFSDRPTFMPNRIVHPGELIDGKRVEGSIAYAWYVWDTSHTGEPIVRWISPQITKSLQERSKEITADLEGRYALAA